MLTAVVGINWGDEGKGRMVDLFASEYDAVVRYQGGNNAGHTVVNERGKFILNLIPSGIFDPNTVNFLSTGMVLDMEHLFGEVARLREQGVEISPKNLRISHRATICLPYHKLLDGLEEDRLADKKFGSTRRGIGPVYGDKYMKKTLRTGDLLLSEAELREKVEGLVEWKNLVIAGGYGCEAVRPEDIMEWLKRYAMPFKDYICDATAELEAMADSGKNVLFEAQLGALRDIDYGIYPYTSSSSTLAAYAPLGAGIPAHRLDRIVGIMKAYSTCVGEGPFVCEMFGPEGDALREAGGEYGAATGRPRRVGGFDIPASRYGVKMQGATEIALTKLDVLSGLERIPVCTAYELDGIRYESFPSEMIQEKASPVYEYLPGFSGDISSCRSFDELPKTAQDYVLYLEKSVGCPISYISVGPERDQYIKR